MRACCSTYICKDRLSFTRFITSKAIKPVGLKSKTIISEFNSQLVNPEMPDDSNLLSGGEEAALDQDINF